MFVYVVAGQYFSLNIGEKCEKCDASDICPASTEYIPCTRRSNTACKLCPSELPDHMEYWIPPGQSAKCFRRCQSGYYMHGSDGENEQCLPCVDVCSNEIGKYQEHFCLEPGQRTRTPKCLDCNNPTKPNEHAIYISSNGCLWDCETGFYPFVEFGRFVCKPCIACPLGSYPTGEKAPCYPTCKFDL